MKDTSGEAPKRMKDTSGAAPNLEINGSTLPCVDQKSTDTFGRSGRFRSSSQNTLHLGIIRREAGGAVIETDFEHDSSPRCRQIPVKQSEIQRVADLDGAEVVFRIARSNKNKLRSASGVVARHVEPAVFYQSTLSKIEDSDATFECENLNKICPTGSHGGRAIAVDVTDFNNGDVLEFVCQMEDGVAYARFLRYPSPSEKNQWENKRFTGKIKSYSSDNGFGFLACSETQTIFGSDVFLHSGQIHRFRIGDTVTFSVNVQKNRPQAYDLASGETTQRYFGQLKSYSTISGYGFIECSATKVIFGRDVFVHNNHINNIQVNDFVEFTVSLKNGQPQAQDVVFVEQSDREVLDSPRDRAQLEGVLFSGILKSIHTENGYGFIASEEIQKIFGKDVFAHIKYIQGFQKGDRLKFYVELNKNQNPQAVDVELDADASSRFLGVIKSFAATRGYGFIDCADTKLLFRRDVFVHKDQMQSFKCGDSISFAVEVKNGQPQAKSLESQPAIQREKLPSIQLGKQLSRICGSHRNTCVEIEELLSQKADPNYIDNTGSTPLMISALNLSPHACWPKIHVLLRSGASLDMQVGEQAVIEWMRIRVGRPFATALLNLDQHIRAGNNGLDVLDEIQCLAAPDELE